MKRILLVVAFVVGTFACSAWSADPLVVGIEPSTQDAWRTLAVPFEASTGVPVKTQPITQNSIAQQVVLQAYQKSGKLHFVMLQTAWTSNLSRYLVDLTEIDAPLRAAGVNPVVVDGRTVGVPISFADGWFLAVTAWPADREPVVPFLIAVAGGRSTTATVAPTGVVPAKTTGASFVPPGKLAVAQHNPKVDGALESLVAAAQSALSAAATSVLSALPATARAAVDHVAKGLGVPFSADTATVTVVLESRPGRTSTSNVAALSALGLKGASVKASSSLIKVSVPISQLATLASQLTGVSFIRPPYTPHALGTPSQGVAAIGATAFHTAGFRGTGVKVAVIDLGFAGLSAAQSRGDLPAGAMQNDLTGTGLQSGISHGTAVAEIVYDIAPDAQLHLIKIADEVDLDLAVTYCIDNGIDIINHSLGWYNTNNYDGTGTICDIARRAINAGILWVNAAGNEAQSHWEGPFVDGNSDGWHDQDITLYASSGSPILLYMTWNEWPASSTDYDLYLYDPNGAVAASSTKHQTGTEEPTESVQTTAAQSGTYRIRFQGTGSRSLEIYSLYQGLSPYVSASSLLAPADLAEAVSVGAINHATYTTGPQEPYSSQGPTNDGRTKPDLACPDNVATGTSPYTTFPGTSGAAPHAAGAAALLLSRQPTLSEPALRAQLLANTVAMGSANIYGQGRLSLQPPTAPNQAPTASFTFSPSSPTPGTTVSFNASASADPDGSIVAYTWNFGDGATGSGVTASRAYAAAGSYTVSLTVRDDDSATNSTTRTVPVQTLLVADLTVTSLTYTPPAPVLGQSITFTVAVANQGSAGAGPFRVLLDGGTSSTFVYVPQLAAGAGQSLTMTLPLASSSQTFTARADDLGQIAEASESNNTRSVTISAGTPPPTAEAGGPYTGTAGAPIAFSGYGSTGTITTYSWSFGDGTSAQGVAPSHAYAAPGTYTATLTVFGPGGQSSDSASVSVTALTPPPTAEAGGPYTGTAGAPIAFNGYGSTGSITTYSWSFGDGTSAQGVALSHAYAAPGTYTATLTVFGPGGQSSDSASVSVTAAQPALNATVALSKATYTIGESISITLTTNRTAYLYVCEVRADQRVLLIYPNRYQPNNRLQPGTVVLPGSGYSLRAAEPAGNETLYLFAATVPIPGFPTSFGSDFPVLSTSPTAFRDSVRATMASLVPDDDRVFRSTGFTIVAAPPTTGTLRVVTTPAGATVRLDGTSIGTSPLERTNILTGQHTVQLSLAGHEVETRQVSIQAGATTNLTVTLTPLVTNQPPTASFSFSPASVAAGQTVVFDATASFDPDGSIASYAWTFGDGATATGSSPSHAYADAGSFTVTLTVRDNGGLSRSTSKTLAITDDPAWVVLVLPAALAADWTDHALALDGDPKTGAIGPATRSQWTSYILFDAPGGGIQCDGLRFRSTFAPPSVISAPGGRGGEPYVLKLSWQVSVRTETGWKLVYEGALAQGEWADVRFDTVAVTEIRFRARGDLRNTLDPKLLEVHLHDASL